MTTAATLTIEDVVLQYPDGSDTVTALDHVDLTVTAGELAAIIGPSGSGKSSLLAVAGGLALPDSGTVRIGDDDMTVAARRARTELRRRNIGFVFQSGNLIPALTASEQIALLGTFGRSTLRSPQELLASVGLADKADRRPHQLSGGERQRVGIARALATSPRILLVDEPTAALDRARSRQVAEVLAREAKLNGVGVLMVTHDHGVLPHCDTVYEMIDGRLTDVGVPA